MIMNLFGSLLGILQLNTVVGSIIRHTLTVGSGALVALGILTPETADGAVTDLSNWLYILLGGVLGTAGLGASVGKK